MRLYRCILLLALLAAVSGTFYRRKIRGPKAKLGKRINRCSLGKLQYVRPKDHGGKYLRVIGAFGLGINPKCKVAREICSQYSKKGLVAKPNDAIEFIVNASKALGVIFDNWISGLGTRFSRAVIGSSKLIHCVLPLKKRGRKRSSYSICGSDFGIKWGWRKYTRGFEYNDIYDFYELKSAKSSITSLIEAKLGKISSLVGTKRIIVDAILQITTLCSRDYKYWSEEDFVLICRYIITIFAGIGAGHNQQTGISIIEEFIEYLTITFKQLNYKKDISSWTSEIKQEVSSCDKEYFNDSFTTEAEEESDESVTTNESSSSSNSDSQLSESQSSDTDSQVTTTTTVTTEEWEAWYNEDGELVKTVQIK